MDSKCFAEKFVQQFPAYEAEYRQHCDDYGEILGHIFFGDAINSVLFELLKKNQDRKLIQKYIGFIEEMYANGDVAVKNVVEVTLLAYLGDDDIVLRNAFSNLSEDLIQTSKKVEALLKRRNIRIFYRRGKILTNWENVAK